MRPPSTLKYAGEATKDERMMHGITMMSRVIQSTQQCISIMQVKIRVRETRVEEVM